MRSVVPSEIRLSKHVLRITFDGTTFALPAELLRVYSPSAEVRGHDGVWNIPPLRRNVMLANAEAVGNYAVKLTFSDLHDSGIFSYKLLFDMGARKFFYMRRYLRELKSQNKQRERKVRHKKV